ncbi:MAG TPA: pyridoxal phosphate-dependent aminotransferase [Vicinamibacterales bacterium]|nr:pyridoxal phosphate-dependent aminotransferase [Vicinamibacterales bacterium]
MKPLSRFSDALPRSGIRAVMELAAQDPAVISLAAGEPSFRTPGHIIDAAMEAARAGHTRYTPSVGIPPLREAVAARCAERWAMAVGAEDVMIGAGAGNAIMATLLVIVDEGDEVLVPDPAWPNYIAQVQTARGVPVSYPLRPQDGYLPDVRALDGLVTARTKAIITNNPSNPCGTVWPRETVAAVAGWARDRDLWVIADEVYEELVFDGEMVWAAPYDRERTIAIGGCSKTCAMTGWRIGWAVSSSRLVDAAMKVQEPLISCASDVSQRAALAALTGPQGFVDEMRAAYRRRRDLVRKLLEPAGLLPTVPSGAFYAMADLRATGLTSLDAAMRMIREERVATVPGTAFGGVAEGFVRLSLASSDEEVCTGCERIVRFAARQRAG